MSVYSKLMKARVQLQSTPLKKSGHNKFAGYQYFELADFMPAIVSIMESSGLCGVVSFTQEVASLRIVDTEDGTEILFTSPMGSAQLKGAHEIQNIGAVQSYQRRYLYMAAFEIVEHDALDASEPVKEAKKNVIKPTDGAMEGLSQTAKADAFRIAGVIQDAFGRGDEWAAFEEWDTTDGDPEFKTAIWSRLDSKCRAAIKRMKAESEKPVEAQA